ncbi:MAG TPA: hypothetical protein VHV75_09680 [Solirubrobacteraceae bacterium]|jgi:hypothetical protein|nr:hypothetical protein [Solirubrobacteraceae bacterium]
MTESDYQVVWPLGRSAIKEIEVTPGVDGLDGRKVAFVWDYLFRGPEIFDAIKKEIGARYPTAEFIDYEAFGNVHGSDEEEKASLDLLPERMREHGADGAVVAVGA